VIERLTDSYATKKTIFMVATTVMEDMEVTDANMDAKVIVDTETKTTIDIMITRRVTENTMMIPMEKKMKAMGTNKPQLTNKISKSTNKPLPTNKNQNTLMDSFTKTQLTTTNI